MWVIIRLMGKIAVISWHGNDSGTGITSHLMHVDKNGYIGIRIEDNVLVTESGINVLTEGLPRSTEQIERFMATGHFDTTSRY